jgi:hypothetical protein
MKSTFFSVLLMAFAYQCGWAEDGNHSVAAGFDYSSGQFGTVTTTDMLYIPVVGKYEIGSWLFKLTVPYLQIIGYGGVVPGVGGVVPVVAANKTTSTRSGLGDVVAAVTYRVYENSGYAFGIDATGKVKLATSDTGLGSGQDDYAGQVDVNQSLCKFTALGSLGYKFLVSSPGV